MKLIDTIYDSLMEFRIETSFTLNQREAALQTRAVVAMGGTDVYERIWDTAGTLSTNSTPENLETAVRAGHAAVVRSFQDDPSVRLALMVAALGAIALGE